jgi:hypothetical protein
VARSVPLSSLAGTSFRLRFIYTYTGGSAYPQTGAGFGWYIDDIGVTDIEQLANPVITSTGVTNFTFNPPQAGNYNLDVRAIIYTQFPLEWGLAKLVTAVGGYSLQFAGNGYVQIAHTNELNVFPTTLTAWITTTNQIVNAEIGIINKYLASSYNGYNLFLSAGHLRAWYFKDAANYVFNGGEGLDGGFVADGHWHHVAFTVDASGGQLYVDGQLKQSTAWTGTPGAPATAEPLRLGIYPGVVASSSNVFQGLLDEVQIWNVARSQAQIQAAKFLPLTGAEANLVAYYPFSEAPGAVTTADLATTLGGVNTGYISNTVARVASSALAGITQTVLTNSQVRLNFNLLFGLPGVFSLQRVGAVAGAWSNDTAAVLATNIAGLSYLFTTPTNAGDQFFYRVKIQ